MECECSECAGAKGKGRGGKPSLREAFVYLTQSRQIRCLAVMALAQGLSTNLIEIAWKSHLHMLHPSPAAYSVSSLVHRIVRLKSFAACATLSQLSSQDLRRSLAVLMAAGTSFSSNATTS